MRKAIGSSYLLRPRLFLSYPCSISAIERRAVGEAAKYAGSPQGASGGKALRRGAGQRSARI